MSIKVLVVEDIPYWSEQLAMMYCRVLRQAKESLSTRNEPPQRCKRCVYASSCIGVPSDSDADSAPREELVKVANNFAAAQGLLKLTRGEMLAGTRKFDIVSLDMNLGGGGGNGEDVLALASAGNGRVSVIAVTGFRNDRLFQQANAERFNQLWSLRRRLSALANGSCEVFEKSHRLADAINVITHAAETGMVESAPLRQKIFEVAAGLQYLLQNDLSFCKLEESSIQDQVARIEASLTLAELQDMVRTTDDPKPLDKDDVLNLHYVVPDDQFSTKIGQYAAIAVNDHGQLLVNFEPSYFNGVGNADRRFFEIDDLDDFAKQLVTRLAVLVSNPLVGMYCSRSTKKRGEPPKEMHPVPELDNRSGAIKLLLTRLGVDRLLQDIDCGEAKDVGSKSKLKVFGLKAGAASPFLQQFGDDVTPRSHYNWRDSGNKGKTSDVPTKGFLNQFLRTLFDTNVNVISRQNKPIRLETKVQIFIHRQKSVTPTRREFALLEWKLDGDEADRPE